MKYSKIEILEYLKANHRQRIQIEKGFPSEEEIIYDLTIDEWIGEMELLPWKELCKYYSEAFEIEQYETEFRNSMLPIDKKTIGYFCEFISIKSVKPKLESVKLFGRDCEEAGIFRYLKRKLIEKDESKSKGIKPSSRIKDHMHDFAFTIIEEVNKIDSKILPTINYEANAFEKEGWKLFLSGIIVSLIASIFDNWTIGGIGFGIMISLVWMDKIAINLKAEKLEFEGIDTFRDLVERIKKGKV